MDDTIRQARHRKRCEECAACKAPECGKCEECVKKRKFGGKGTNKRPCVERRCLNLQIRFVGPRTSGTSSSLFRPNGSGAVTTRVSASASARGSRTKRDFPPIPFLLHDEPSNKRVCFDKHTLEDVPPTHFCGLSVPPKLVGVCAMCGTDDGPSDQILLCDGKGCGREVHRSCSWPPLLEIPEGDFYCWYCTRQGSTEELQQYFLDHERVVDALAQSMQEGKEGLPSSIVDSLLDQDVGMEISTTSDTLGQKGKQTGSYPRRRVVYPMSELDSYHVTPDDSFVGKPLRLYTSHQCHTGRILQVRFLKQQKNRADAYPRDTVCLVLFPAGRDFRKTPFTTWLHLEEHAIEVATEMLWGVLNSSFVPSPGTSTGTASVATAGNTSSSSQVMDSLGTTVVPAANGIHRQDTKKSSRSSINKPLVPAQLWARTARELVKVVRVPHHPHLIHVQYRRKTTNKNDPSSPPQKRREWGLVQAFGSSKNEMIYLPRVRLESKNEGGMPSLLSLATDSKPSTVPHIDIPATQARAMTLLVSMMAIEKQSQERVRQWNQEFPSLQPFHPHALQLQDEGTLGTLEFDQTCVKQSLIQPSPLIPHGLDRMHILGYIKGSTNATADRAAAVVFDGKGSQPLGMTKDAAATLTCRLVGDTAGSIWKNSSFSTSTSSC